MKNWNKFRNWLVAFLSCELILLGLSFLFARDIILEQIIFLILALFAVLVLSDLLLTWLLLLALGIGLIFLSSGIVYIPIVQLLFLLVSFPLLIGILIKVRNYYFKAKSMIQDQVEIAREDCRIFYCLRFFLQKVFLSSYTAIYSNFIDLAGNILEII